MNKLYSSRAFQFFAIIIISALCLLLDTLTRISFNKIELPKNSPEYNAEGVNGSVYNKSGKLLYNLKGKFAWQFPDDKKVYMKDLQLLMYSESSDSVKYQITSNDGWVNHSAKMGFLGNNSQVTIFDNKPEKTTKIYGKNISLDISNNIFKSLEEVRAIQGRSALYSHGFTYDQKKSFLTLNSKVRVIYEK